MHRSLMSATTSFSNFLHQLDSDLHTLSSESKRRNSEIKHASDKSIEILKTVHNFEDLTRHPDFVVPFVLSCSSRNAKFTSISMQCLQKLSSTNSIPKERIEDVLNSFIESTHLAVEIQLKVLQIIPLFFKTYSKNITGKLCGKILLCCSSLLQLPNKAPMVVGSASATLQQLINDIFERAAADGDDMIEVATGNNTVTKVGSFRHDANRVFADLCSLNSTNYNNESVLNISSIPEDYGLEILESVLKNHQQLFENCLDLQFLLRTKAVPLLLRSISSSRTFSIVVRSARCIFLLIKREYISILELELEVILSLLIHILKNESETPFWKKILSLEIFQSVCKDFQLLKEIFKAYDSLPDRKQILASLLVAFEEILAQEEYSGYLKESKILARGDMPIISHESSVAKIQFIDLLDKTTAPFVDQTYIIYLILTAANSISVGLGSDALLLSQKQNNDKEMKDAISMFNLLFHGLFVIHKKFLYASTLDTSLFHSLVRAFQKLSHTSGILGQTNSLNECLNLFALATIQNTIVNSEVEEERDGTSSINVSVFNSISDTLIGQSPIHREETEVSPFHSRNIQQRNINLFRALISLSVSLGSNLSPDSWRYVLLTWQWISYYVYGPSKDFTEEYYSKKIPPGPQVSKSDVHAIELSIAKFFDSTLSYSNSSFNVLLKSLVEQSSECFSLPKNTSDTNGEGFSPTDHRAVLQCCVYNRVFFVIQIGELSTFNFNRFVNENRDRGNWSLVTNYLIEQMANRQLPSVTLRLETADIFTDIITKLAEEASERKLDDTHSKFGDVEDQLLNALMKVIDTIMGLGISKDDVNSGAANTESDILFQSLRTLKDLLDNFGDSMTHSWDTVFRIINSPFEIIGINPGLEQNDDVEDNSIIEVISAKQKNMIQMSFDVFKLISDDFLQTLPLGVIREVIDTLLNFVKQEKDLNISFSSISQFWLVGDYLRTCISKSPTDDREDQRKKFAENVEKGKLTEIITSADLNTFDVYNGLWLYLLKKLVACTEDKRLEVKNGAIQTFFRIVDSHSSCFPSWELISIEVIAPLLQANLKVEDAIQTMQFLDIKLEGLVHLYPTYLCNFESTKEISRAWSLLINYMQSLVELPSFDLKFITLSNLKILLTSVLSIDGLPDEITEQFCSLWLQYNVIYGDYSKSTEPKQKTSYDCLHELLMCYPPLHKLLDQKNLLNVEKIEKFLSIFNSAVRYPLLPEYSSDKSRPSSLQQAVFDSLRVYDYNQLPEIESLLLNQISAIVILPFDTLSRIETKLAPKLTTNSKARIPSFESISYCSCKYLFERVLKIEPFTESYITSKSMCKILRNLREPVVAKSLIGGGQEENSYLWVTSSQCFLTIARKVLSLYDDDKISQDTYKDIRTEFIELFMSVAVAPLKRLTPEIDLKTEKDDISLYNEYKELLLQHLDLDAITETHLQNFISTVWSSSFFYEVDEIEDAIIHNATTLSEVAERLANFEFDDILGSTSELHILSKYNSTSVCLQDLVNFTKFEGSGFMKLRKICVTFLVARCAFVLRRYISDESLIRRAPIAKIRKLEIVVILEGLSEVLRFQSLVENENGDQREILQSMKVLYPLLLKTMPVSNKVEGLQPIVQNLSIKFTKVVL